MLSSQATDDSTFPTAGNAITLSSWMVWMEDYLCRCIWANKGTYAEEFLQNTIRVHNNLSKINMEEDLEPAQVEYTVKTVRRFNLSFKVDQTGTLIDLSDSVARSGLPKWEGHPELTGEPDTLLEENTGPHPITGVPLSFLLENETHRLFLWHYTRYLWYTSQVLLLKKDLSTFFDAEPILSYMDPIREGMDQEMEGDPFLEGVLYDKDAAISKKTVKIINKAFERHNISENDPLREVVTIIVTELHSRKGFSKGLSGDTKKETMDIAQKVVKTLRGSGRKVGLNKNVMRKLTTILREILEETGEELPADVQKLVGAVREGMEGDEPMSKEKMAEVAHKAGITPAQLSNYMTSLVGNVTGPGK